MLIRVFSKLFGIGSQSEEATEMNYENALTMVRLFNMLDYTAFARKPRADGSQAVRVNHRSIGPKDENVIYTNAFTSNQLESQINDAFNSMSEAGAETFPISDREIVLRLLKTLNTSFGNEGAKRFAELSYIALDQASKQNDDPTYRAGAEFWADFRTFIDVERATQIGVPFDIEHFLGDVFVTNDTQGPRIRFQSGASMSPTVLQQMARQQRSQF